MNKTQEVFNLLNKEYGEQYAWTEVQEVLNEEAKNIEIDKEVMKNPFKNLIIGILSQNTNDKNSTRAFIGLKKSFNEITPEVMAKAKINKIRSAIKPGGLYNIKAKRLKKLAKHILKEYKGDLTQITNLNEKKTRKELLKMPGIGQKTADVFISECLDHGTIAIDTNINRVVKRLGIVEKDYNYNKTKKILEKDIEKKDRQRAHELLVRLGRDYCKARNPLCKNCPLEEICDKKIQ